MRITRVMRLERTYQDASIYKHWLNEVRIDALATNGLIVQERGFPAVAFRPLMELSRPFFRIGSLLVSNEG